MLENKLVKKVALVGGFLSSLTATTLGTVQIDKYGFRDVLTTVDIPVAGTVDILLADAVGGAIILAGVALSGILFGGWSMMNQIDQLIVSLGSVGFLAHAISPSVQNFVQSNISVQVAVVLLVTLAVVGLYRDNMSRPIQEELLDFN